jgi:hypothetical protein
VAYDDVVNLLDFMYNGEVKVRHCNIQVPSQKAVAGQGPILGM